MKRREFIILLGGVLRAGGALLATAFSAQGIGRWFISTPMPSSRTEVAVAEVGGKIYVVGDRRPRRAPRRGTPRPHRCRSRPGTDWPDGRGRGCRAPPPRRSRSRAAAPPAALRMGPHKRWRADTKRNGDTPARAGSARTLAA